MAAGSAAAGCVSLAIASLVAMAVFFVGLGDAPDPPRCSFGGIAFGIIGAVKAFHMEWWRYPINLRLVKP